MKKNTTVEQRDALKALVDAIDMCEKNGVVWPSGLGIAIRLTIIKGFAQTGIKDVGA